MPEAGLFYLFGISLLEKGWISQTEYEEIKDQLQAFGLPVRTQGLKEKEEILQTTRSDKKMAGRADSFYSVKRLGKCSH